ncbi:S-adenosylmethionine:tRNA ribosyltransferase-isomerase, partial [Staphylococcus aureus]
ESLSAGTTLKASDHRRLLIMVRETSNVKHLHFRDVIGYFRTGESLVLNDMRIEPASRFGFQEEPDAKVEMFLLTQIVA